MNKLDAVVSKPVRILIYVLMVLPFLWSFGHTFQTAAQNEEGLVYVVDVKDTVERGLYAYMERGFREAEEAGAEHIILDIDTPGGAVIAAEDIGHLMQNSDIPITAFVNPNATSAGAFIALNADNIVMAPTASMGSAAVVDLEGNMGDEKTTAFWISKMESAAEVNGRDPIYARAMVDPDVAIEGLVAKGKLLDFTATKAKEHGYAEAIADDLEGVLAFLGLEGATVEHVEMAFSEHLARFITHPIVASILLSLAGLGLIVELYSPGFGVPGSIGIASLLLYFFGHLIAGFAGWESVILLAAGLVLIMIEIFVPGFGIFGILGLAAMIGSIALASEDVVTGLINMGIALVVTVIVALILARFMNKKGVWNQFVLREGVPVTEMETMIQKKSELIGKKGVTVTPLRPSGTVKIDGKHYDVVSIGSFVDKGSPVQVENVDGPRIVVSEIEDDEE